MRDTFSRTLYDIAKARPKVFIVVADISPAGSMAKFREEFPDRFYNVGVAEQSMIGACAGLAMRGCKAFAYSIATFSLYRPFEQIRVDLCYQNLPVTVVGIGGGLAYSTLGGTHHAQEDIAIMGGLPNMSILAPCDPLETVAAAWACADHPGPTYLRLGKAGEPTLTADAVEPFTFGKIRLIKPGSDIAFLSYGPIMKMTSEIAARVEKELKQSAALFSVPTIKPLDSSRLREIYQKYSRVVIIEEHSERAGLAAQAKALAYEYRATCDLVTFSLKDEFIHVFGTPQDLWKAHGIDAETVFQTIVRR